MTEFKEFLRNLADECLEEYERIAESGGHRKDISQTAETVTEVDRKMTEVIVEAFEDRPESFRFESEEMKKDPDQEYESLVDYTVIFDEIDGTGNMKDSRGPFGPIVGIAEGDEPNFEDMISCSFYDFRNEALYEAYRGEGAFMEGSKIEVKMDVPEQKEAVRGLVDQAMLGKLPGIAEPLWKYHCKDFGSTAFHLALLASGKADFFVTGGYSYLKDSNTAEEIGPLYRLLDEAGATVLTWEGEELGGKEIGLEKGLNHDYVAAGTEELAYQIVNDIEEYTM